MAAPAKPRKVHRLPYAYIVYIMAACGSSTTPQRPRRIRRSTGFHSAMRKACLRIRSRSPSKIRMQKTNLGSPRDAKGAKTL